MALPNVYSSWPYISRYAIGDRVKLKSGGPECLVVDFMMEKLTIAWKCKGDGAVHELTVQSSCVKRAA